ncbi:restriction endonuclease subunit S [Photobacterium damselae subsp. damselae]|uniref:restriction endonuclease subunit S n=1 Tax=Photobacterium damselae TaxID=38293 RepID=UPI0010FD373C|nr:restriction endonuclease subunit S [Photobacterium damselae]MBA5682527.1 restriction endonuclease subunit S [Photobacterium damselae subsp. damselae]TLS81870.1 restriction endonuclease subunit S [Photobacterium damselae subsp. damselae]TLS88997.1 restriction endonuclease subunit S [Photobacterium damselae subsp. damselae]UKA03480.1 restriction endonuclease subunit S [Photobacterium damselae subsp. damselae]
MGNNFYSSAPNSWSIKKFGDIAKITCGVAATPEYVDESIGVPFFSASNVQKGKLKLNKIKYIPVELHNKLTKNTKPEKGDVLMTRVGAGIGEAAVVTVDYDFSVYVSLTLIKCGKLLDSNFVQAVLNTDYYRYLALREQFAGGGVQNLNVQMVKDYIFPVPPIPEQRKIAQILSTWDRGIATTEKLIDASKQQKKALMQQLLTGKKRLINPETGKAFQGEWKFKSISNISTRIQRKTDGQEHPILTISSLSGFVSQSDKYSRYMAGESVKNYILLNKGEFAYNKGNSKTYQFGCVFDLDTFDTGLVPHVYVCFKLKDGLSHNYFKYLFEADYLKPQLAGLVNTGVRNNGLLNIKPAEFMKTKVPVPCYEEQEKIAKLLHASSRHISALEAKLAHLKQEKKALMQQLLTGKRRVNIAEIKVATEETLEVEVA